MNLKKNNNIKLVFFDLGSVLINVHIDKFYFSFSQHTGLSMDAIKQKSKSLQSVVSEFNCGRITSVEFYNNICNGFNKLSFEDFADIYTNIFTLNEDIAFIVSKLKNYVRLSIISNTDEMHYGYIVNHFPVMKVFENPVTSFWAQSIKPDKEIFLYALRKVKLAPDACLFIDDNRENVDSANTLGLNGLQFTNIETLKKDLKIYGFNL